MLLFKTRLVEPLLSSMKGARILFTGNYPVAPRRSSSYDDYVWERVEDFQIMHYFLHLVAAFSVCMFFRQWHALVLLLLCAEVAIFIALYIEENA